MRISILHFRGCPNHEPTVARVRQLVAEYGLDARIEEIKVETESEAPRHGFLGSPTVQVDGVDIEPAARNRSDFGLTCRVYATPDRLPSPQMILAAMGVPPLPGQALADGDTREAIVSSPSAVASGDRRGAAAVGGSVIAAALSSACCWVPLVLLAVGASAAGLSGFFERWRPLFIALAVLMLGLGFFFAYRPVRARADGCCGSSVPPRRRAQRVAIWVSALLVAAFIFFPSYVGLLGGVISEANTSRGAEQAAESRREYVFLVEGMHCAGCAAVLSAGLAEVESIREIAVNYESRTARFSSPDDAALEQAVAAARALGYTLSPEPDHP